MKGFTLIEIIIVIAILGILVAVVVPNFPAYKSVSDLNNNAEEFVSILRLAQSQTISSSDNSHYGVYINTAASPNQYILFKGLSYDSKTSSQVYALQDKMEFYGISLGGGNEIVFDRLTGAPEEYGSVSLRVKTDTSKNKTIYIDSSGAIGFNQSAGSLGDSRISDTRHVEFDYNRIIDTATETITLTFDNNQPRVIPISSFLQAGQLQWHDTISVEGSNQVLEMNTRNLNSNGTVFSVRRDRRYNDKGLTITISGDASGFLLSYPADGSTTNHASIYVSNVQKK